MDETDKFACGKFPVYPQRYSSHRTMTKAQLPVQHLFQRNDTECTWCVASMIHSIRGHPRTVDEIEKSEGLFAPPFTSYAGQLAHYLKSQDFPVKLIVSNSKLIPPNWSTLPRTELEIRLKEWVTAHHSSLLALEAEHIANFLEIGGQVEVCLITKELLQDKLEKGSLLAPFLDEVWLWGHRIKKGIPMGIVDNVAGESVGHAVLLPQLQNDKVEVWDPYPTGIDGRNGCYFVSLEDIVGATLTWDAMIVEVMNEG